MFNVRPRPRPQLLGTPPSKKRKIASSAPAEITFDPAAREEYLTGFHKRKEARKKHAQEENARKEKEEKLKFRKEVRCFMPLGDGVERVLEANERVDA